MRTRAYTNVPRNSIDRCNVKAREPVLEIADELAFKKRAIFALEANLVIMNKACLLYTSDAADE